MSAIHLIIAAIIGVAAAMYGSFARSRRRAREARATARTEAKSIVRSAGIEAAALRRAAETAAREEVLDLRARADDEQTAAVEALARLEARVAERDAELDAELAALDERAEALEERQRGVRSLRDRARGLDGDTEARRAEARRALEAKAGASAEEVAAGISQGWIEEAAAQAAQRLRVVEQSASDPEYGRSAQRILAIAVSRYKNHFLTERAISNIPISAPVAEALTDRVREAIEEVSNIQLHLSDTGASVRLEGLDGVGREVCRRALSRLAKKPAAAAEAQRDPVGWARAIRTQLEREITGLGRKAFSVLKVPRAHPEIIDLVGALNYRTSYTQNQWRHAVEASFLAGMMACELDLDIVTARRATLLHDIGKALTHQIEGSHAVIGADIARRLGEPELVANCIGSHHLDETPNSVYAHIVIAADAMSGARPGARRELGELYNTRLDDLERIGAGYRGVERAFAVHGGRELRVYVRESEVSDIDAVEMSSEIAEQIAEELTFPGQIKVTVIRAFEAVSVAS